MLVAMIDIPRFPADALTYLPLLKGLVDGLILRAPALPAGEFGQFGRLVAAAAGSIPLTVNGRLAVALAVGAAGLHLPADHLPARDVRPFWPGTLSASVHSVDELAYHAAADWFLWGHVFPSRSKPGAPARDWSLLRQVVQAAGRPVLAIGGITADNVPQLAGMGLAGVAVSDGIWRAADPVRAAEKLASAIADRTWRAKEERG